MRLDVQEKEKQDLRKKYTLIRNEVKNKKEKSKKIIEKIKANDMYKKARVIALYKSLLSEVDTTELINYSINIKKIVVLPRVSNNELKFYKINSLKDKFIKSKFGVEEPVGNENNYINKTNIDLIVVPGLCFDKEKNRLGFGKGYYDRYLASTELKSIGVCFNEQILDRQLIPITSNDVKMQLVITDVETI